MSLKKLSELKDPVVLVSKSNPKAYMTFNGDNYKRNKDRYPNYRKLESREDFEKFSEDLPDLVKGYEIIYDEDEVETPKPIKKIKTKSKPTKENE